MDLTPAFFDRWREHRELEYMDRVREIFEQAAFDDPWLEEAQLRAVAIEVRATLHLAGVDVDEEAVKAVVDRDETGGLDAAALAAVRGWHDARSVARAAVGGGAAVTPALLDDLHARLSGLAGSADHATDGALDALCGWLAAPPAGSHPVVVAATAHVELLRLRRWPDAGARLARLALLMLLHRAGYGYRGLLSPSVHWSDPRRLPATPAEELTPKEAETHPAVEHVVGRLAASLRDTVSWVRAEESAGSVQAMAFGWPLQP